MPTSFHLHSGWVAAEIVAIGFMLLYPLALALLAHKQLGVSWRYFGYGALIFLLFQVLTRVPLTTVVGAVFGKQIQASPVLLWSWLGVLVVTAGLFEEVGRYIGYRWLMRQEDKTWNKAVMYGLGHGGLESMLVVGGLGLLTLVNLFALSAQGLATIPAARRPQVAHQLAVLAAQPDWLPLLGAWERLWALPIHVALSVLVLQVFRRGNIGWLWLAVAAHAVVDGVTVGTGQLLGADKLSTKLVTEGIVAIFGLIAIWVIVALRQRPEDAPAPMESPPVSQTLPHATP
jgi:uncharacterized membrane protein YhfC